jgi:hypothetical protein
MDWRKPQYLGKLQSFDWQKPQYLGKADGEVGHRVLGTIAHFFTGRLEQGK